MRSGSVSIGAGATSIPIGDERERANGGVERAGEQAKVAGRRDLPHRVSQ
jgi:hypothetical protein